MAPEAPTGEGIYAFACVETTKGTNRDELGGLLAVTGSGDVFFTVFSVHFTKDSLQL